MQRIDGLSHEEIAATLRVSKSMVEKYIAKAVGALRAALVPGRETGKTRKAMT
jgi:DNA-directed RNA polymerase specialized sigma24 family protein